MQFVFYFRWLWVSALLTGFQPAAGACEGRYPGQPGVSAVLVIPAGTGGGLRVTLPEGAYWPDGGVSHSAKNIAIPSQPEPLSFCYSGHWPGSGEQPPSQCYSLLLLPSPEPVTATATDNSGLPLTLLNGVISRLVASAQDFIPGWLSAPVRLDVPDLNEGQQPGLPLASLTSLATLTTLTNDDQGDLVPDFDLSAPQPRFQLVSSRPPVFLELFPQPVMKMAAPDGDGDDDGNPDQLLYYDHDGALRAINLPPGLPVEDEVRLSSRERALLRRSSPDLNDPDRHYRAIIKSVLKGRITLASHQGHKVYILRTADGRTLVLSKQQIEGILFSHSSLGNRHYEHDPYAEFLQTRYHWPWFRQGRVDRKPAVQIPTAAPGSRIKGDPAGPSSGTPEDPLGKGNNGKGIGGKEEKITNWSAIGNIDRRDNGTAGNSSSLAPVVARKVTRASVTRAGSATTVAVDFLMLNKKAEAFSVAIETAKEFLTLEAQQEATITLCLDGALQALGRRTADSDQEASFRHTVQTGLECLNLECLNKGIDNQETLRRNAAGLAIAVTIALSLLSAGGDSQDSKIVPIRQTLQSLAEAVTAAGESSPGFVTGELEAPVAWLVALRDQASTGANWLLPSSGATRGTKVKRLLEAIDQVKSPSQGAQVSAHQHWLQEAFYEIQRGLRLKAGSSDHPPHPPHPPHPAIAGSLTNASASASVIPQVQPGNITAFLQRVVGLNFFLSRFMNEVTGIYASRPREAEKRVSEALTFFVNTQAQMQAQVQVHHGAGADGSTDVREQEKPLAQASECHPVKPELALATASSSLGGGGDGGDPVVVMATSNQAAGQAYFLNNTSMVQEKKDPEAYPIFEAKYYHAERATDRFNMKLFKEDGRLLGSGSFGTRVFYGILHSETGQKFEVAVKRHKETSSLNPVDTELSRRQFGTEMGILTRYLHKNIIRLIGFSSDGPALCLIYEYMERGTLSRCLAFKKDDPRALTYGQRLIIAVGLAEAIDFLHNNYRQAVIHRNVKASHVLLDQHCQPCLGGFGRAVLADEVKNLKSEKKPDLSFTAQAYMSPEALLDPNEAIITPAMDVYALGMVLLELATGLPLYSTKKKQSLKFYLDHVERQNVDMVKMLDPGAWFPKVEEVVKGRDKRQVQNLGLLLLGIANDATRRHITVPRGAQNIALRPDISVVLQSLQSLIKLDKEAVLLSSDK